MMSDSFETCDCKVPCQLKSRLKCTSNEDTNNNQVPITQSLGNQDLITEEFLNEESNQSKKVSLLKVTKFDENLYSIPTKVLHRPLASLSNQSTSSSSSLASPSSLASSSSLAFPSLVPPRSSLSAPSAEEELKPADHWSLRWPYINMAYIYVIKTGRYIKREIPYEITAYLISMCMIITMIMLSLSEPCLSRTSVRNAKEVEANGNQLINNLKLSNHSSTNHYHVIALGPNQGNASAQKVASHLGLNASASDHDFTATVIHPPVNQIPREESSTLLVRDYLKVTKKSVGGVGIHSPRYDSNVDSLAKGPLAPAMLINRIYPFYPHPFIQRSSSQPEDLREHAQIERPFNGRPTGERPYSENEINDQRLHDKSNYYQPSSDARGFLALPPGAQNFPPDVQPLPPPPPPPFVPDIIYGHHPNRLNEAKIRVPSPNNGNNLASPSGNNIASESSGDYVSLPIPDHLKNATLDWFKTLTGGSQSPLPAKYSITGGRIEYKHDPGSTPVEKRYDFGPIGDAPSGYVRNGKMISNHDFSGILRTSSSRESSRVSEGEKKKKRQKCVCQEVDSDVDEIDNMIESDPMSTGYVPMLAPPEMKATKVLKSAGIPIPSSTEKRCLVYDTSPSTSVIMKPTNDDDSNAVPLIRDYVTPNGERIVVPFPSSNLASSNLASSNLASPSLASSFGSSYLPSSSSLSNYNPIESTNHNRLNSNQFIGGGSQSGGSGHHHLSGNAGQSGGSGHHHLSGNAGQSVSSTGASRIPVPLMIQNPNLSSGDSKVIII